MEVVCLILGPMLASWPCLHSFWVLMSLNLLIEKVFYYSCQAELVYLQNVLLSKAKKAGNTEQDSCQLPFYCNFNFMCLVSVHAQTLYKYPDTDLDDQFMDNYLDNRIYIHCISVPALIIIHEECGQLNILCQIKLVLCF